MPEAAQADPAALAAAIAERAHADADAGARRLLVAIAGAPGSGKSTFSERLAHRLNAAEGPGFAAVLQMDGYHFDNAVLDARGLRDRKGSPPTFDVDGLAGDLARLAAGDRTVVVPVFDRTLDLARAGAREIGPEIRVVLVEGNYLLLDDPPWDGLARWWGLTVFLDVPRPVLEDRLIRRWLDHGRDRAAAEAWVRSNDLPNADTVIARSRPAEWRVANGSMAGADSHGPPAGAG